MWSMGLDVPLQEAIVGEQWAVGLWLMVLGRGLHRS
jgi:hypothetical protein